MPQHPYQVLGSRGKECNCEESQEEEFETAPPNPENVVSKKPNIVLGEGRLAEINVPLSI